MLFNNSFHSGIMNYDKPLTSSVLKARSQNSILAITSSGKGISLFILCSPSGLTKTKHMGYDTLPSPWSCLKLYTK